MAFQANDKKGRKRLTKYLEALRICDVMYVTFKLLQGFVENFLYIFWSKR